MMIALAITVYTCCLVAVGVHTIARERAASARPVARPASLADLHAQIRRLPAADRAWFEAQLSLLDAADPRGTTWTTPYSLRLHQQHGWRRLP